MRLFTQLLVATRWRVNVELIKNNVILTILIFSPMLQAAEWGYTEFQLQKGKLDAPTFAGGETASTLIVTVEHANGWKYGQNFFFVDFAFDDNNDGFNEASAFSEFIPALSLNKMTSSEYGVGVIKDIGVVLGANVATTAKAIKIMPGIKLFWDVPGFSYLNTDVMAYLDRSKGVDKGGAPAQDDSWQVDTAFHIPIQWGNHHFSVGGHIEYIADRKDEFGNTVQYSVLSQTQFRYDLGYGLWDLKDKTYIGIEYQYWRNKLGDPNTTESTPQLLWVWRF